MPHLTQYSVNASPWREESFSAGTPLSAWSPSAFCRAETHALRRADERRCGMPGRYLRDDVAHDAVLDELRDGVVREGGAQALVLLCMCATMRPSGRGWAPLSSCRAQGCARSFKRTVK